MKKFLRLLFDESLLKFFCVGALNTVVSAVIMFGMYQLLQMDRWPFWGYWISSGTAYVLSSILSFVLNRRFTFAHKGPVVKSAVRFAVVIAVCYLFAFKVAKPVTAWFLPLLFGGHVLTVAVTDQASMLVGMIIFTLFNYFGQRFFAFRKCEG